VTSLVFLEAWRQRSSVQFHQESILPWLIGVAHNVVRNMWRSSLRHRQALSRIRIEVAAAPEDDVAGRVDDERRMAQVRRLVDRWPPPIGRCSSCVRGRVVVRGSLRRARRADWDHALPSVAGPWPMRELEAEALAEPWESRQALTREEKE
jgi:hypothetical protein